MNARYIGAQDSSGAIIDDMLTGLLAGWDGLRLYVHRRQAGGPVDETLETLLRERLRVEFDGDTDIGAIIASWLTPRAR